VPDAAPPAVPVPAPRQELRHARSDR
jgi:hypothetical protein